MNGSLQIQIKGIEQWDSWPGFFEPILGATSAFENNNNNNNSNK